MYIGTALLLPGVRQVLTLTVLGSRCDWANWTGTLSGYSFYCVQFWTGFLEMTASSTRTIFGRKPCRRWQSRLQPAPNFLGAKAGTRSNGIARLVCYVA